MKKRKLILFFVALIAGLFGIMNKDQIKMAVIKSVDHPTAVGISGEAALVMDAETGKVILSKNEKAKMYPASTTKLLTALVVLDESSPEEQLKVGNEVSYSQEGEARAGLFEGQILTVGDALGAMLLPSGNDAARSLAIYIARKNSGNPSMGVEEGIAYFSDLMNAKAKEIGATHSHFSNPHGLHNENHYSTAEDLALIAMEASKHETIKSIVGSEYFTTKTNTYENRNKLVNHNSEYYYQAATGMKTGFTDQAGYCLVTSAERDGHELIAVVLNSGKESIWSDSITALDYGFMKVDSH
ncbi:D-alanyl-D-alanine carboxypeptidase family protein [Lederbergia citrea]|uniref:D-alanyl-D-alanine carboxypeptidase family protein n=1 Tax=Lederbergia citrea TaxID=2833581 RepID=UPI001BC931D3|nr:D-alanyl-D-alanine carboxypeptidase [Lederbergia citrea]